MPVRVRTRNSKASDLRSLAAFHQLSPNPLLAVNAAGKVTFTSDATARVLESLGPSASAAAFFPADMESILALLHRRENGALRREVEIGGRVFTENVLVRPDHDVVFIHATDITEFRRAEQELRRQDALLKALVESPTDVMVFALDRDCRYTVFNSAHRLDMKELHGADIRPGTSLLDAIGKPDLRARIEQAAARTLAGESFTSVEFDSELDTWRELNWNPIRSSDGSVEGAMVFAQDITRRKRVEEALAESEVKYRRLFESSNDAIMLLDTERFFDCNKATLRVFGCSTRDEFLGKHPSDVSPPQQADGRDSRQTADERIADALRTGRNYFEWLHQRADGTVFPADVLLTPLEYRGRKVLQATVRDISDRKQTEVALRESAERYRRLVEEMGEGIGETDAEEWFLFANRAAEELFGVPPGGLVGRNLREFLDLDQAEVIRQQSAQRRTGKRSSYELEITRPDRTKRTALVTTSPRQDDNGNFVGSFGIFRDITEHRKTERLARAERDRLRRILDAMPDGVYMVGQDYRLQYINPALLARGGPVNNRLCYEYFHARTAPCVNCANPQAFTGASTHREYTTRNGNITYDIQDVPVAGDDGRPARLVFMRDVTARRRMEAEVALRAELLDAATDLVIVHDLKGNIVYVNEAACRAHGYEREQLQHMTLRQLVAPEQRESALPHLDLLAAGYDAAFQTVHCRKDGSRLPIEVHARVVESAGGKTVISIVRDITERRQAEERDLQHLADTALLRDTALGFITLDPKTDIYRYVARRLAQLAGEAYVVVSSYDEDRDEFRVRAIEGVGEDAKAALRLLGRPPVGTTFRPTADELRHYVSGGLRKMKGGLAALSSGRMPTPVSEAIESVFGPGEAYAMLFYWQGKTLGSVSILMHEDVPLRDPGLVEAFVNQAAIAIQHRRDADELERHREHLEELVRNRTAELEAANRELEAFSYSVSHDLRAPLRAIDGFTQALIEDQGTELNPRARDDLARVSSAAQRMAQLIDDLLDLARIARMPLDRRKVDLSELARVVVAELRQAAPDRKVEFLIPDGLTSPADPVLAAMVLQNLLGNSWKFTSRNPMASIEFGLVDDGGERVFFVRDDGVGFDMAYAGKLFAPFERLHPEHDFPGTGIGLAIVQRIVHRHGGRVWFEAEVDRGATCRFTLEPAAKEA
ncbi:PAS domain S-box protein [candidate division WOR-3 bacterium]|nr:PAS domain S-box protein [candidate division WOR-3 bacterium]